MKDTDWYGFSRKNTDFPHEIVACLHPVFSIVCHVFHQSVSLYVFPYVVIPSLFRSTSAPSPRNFLSQRFCTLCGWVLTSSSGQTTLFFCFLGKFQQVLCVPASWPPHFWCDPTWSSLLPISTSSFRLNFVCSRVSFLRPVLYKDICDYSYCVNAV